MLNTDKPCVPSLAVLCAALFAAIQASFCQQWITTSAPKTNWATVAMSADGTKCAAGVYNGPIYLSANGGATWTASTAPITAWKDIASSADGSVLVGLGGGFIYLSRDSGATWNLSGSAHSQSWTSIACSADGGKMFASVWFSPIWISFDTGANWSESRSPNPGWYSIAASADGNQVVAVANNGGQVYRSSNSGVDWLATSLPSANWGSVASSADGSILVAGGIAVDSGAGLIYTSTDGGETWRLGFQSDAKQGYWWSDIASSADGTVLAASKAGSFGNPGGRIFMSWNSGEFWSDAGAPFAEWSGIASSADGRRIVAAENGGGICILEIGTVATLPPRGTNGTAILQGVVNPNGNETTVWFEWGLTPAHGNTTAPRVVRSSGPMMFDQVVTALNVGIEYYFRLVATNSNGVFLADDRIYRAPRIELLGGNSLDLDFDDTFQDPGAYVTNEDVAITVTGTVMTAVPGVYVLSYGTTNSLGIVGTTNRTVTMRGPQAITSSVLAQVTAFRSATSDPRARVLDKAVISLNRAAAANLWSDESHLIYPAGQNVFSGSAKAASLVTALARRKQSPLSSEVANQWAFRLATADRLLAVTEIDAAIEAGAMPSKLKGAAKQLDAGDQTANSYKFVAAISHYCSAWKQAAREKGKEKGVNPGKEKGVNP